MTRPRILLLCLAACVLFLPAITGGVAQVAPAPEPSRKKKQKLEFLDVPTDGVVKGKITLVGQAPKMASLKEIMQKNQDRALCLSGTEFEQHDQTWVVSKDGGVANVVVQLVPPTGKKFRPLEPDQREVEIDQPHCMFLPHVVALKHGQVLRVCNSAGVPHNTKIVGEPGENEEKNVIQPPNNPGKNFDLNPQRGPVRLSCQIHPWMTAEVYVADHPYITTTREDGSFEFKNVPTKTLMTLTGTHAAGKVEEMLVRLSPGQAVAQDLKITAR